MSFTKGDHSLCIVPPVEQIARKMVDTSQIMIVVQTVLKLGPRQLLRLGYNNLPYLPRLAKMEFAVGIKLLCELEILAHPTTNTFVLHSQMTDMALALQNHRVIAEFLQLSRRYHFVPGIATYNPELLTRILADMPHLPSNLTIYTKSARMSQNYRRFAEQTRLQFAEIAHP